ncbi:MucR family transcriptional regulator [Yunchengibacter salinarum]|uniref:MucR family transcriptional regulator n=1 Tax=Yunchengibacter salinarum TaxID=3133399 RepID=UPI0035B60A9D
MDKTAEEQSLRKDELLSLTADIVSAHVTNNTVTATELPKLIEDVYNILNRVDGGEKAVEEKPEPAVPIKKSIQPDYIVCLEDGKKLKMLKRHIKTRYDMSPEDYRERWGLPSDYPMVAPNYAKQRRELAKKIGLGRTPKKKA